MGYYFRGYPFILSPILGWNKSKIWYGSFNAKQISTIKFYDFGNNIIFWSISSIPLSNLTFSKFDDHLKFDGH